MLSMLYYNSSWSMKNVGYCVFQTVLEHKEYLRCSPGGRGPGNGELPWLCAKGSVRGRVHLSRTPKVRNPKIRICLALPSAEGCTSGGTIEIEGCTSGGTTKGWWYTSGAPPRFGVTQPKNPASPDTWVVFSRMTASLVEMIPEQETVQVKETSIVR